MAGSGLKILQVSSARSTHFGAMRSLLQLVAGIKPRGHRVEFLTYAGRGLGPSLREAGETVHELKVRGKINPVAIIRMARLMRSLGSDVVHTHLSSSSTNGALAARLAGIPSVATCHGMSSKGSFIFAHHVIAVSQGVKDHLVGQGLAANKISVVYNGIDFPSFTEGEREALGKELDVSDRFPVMGTVARLTKLKGIEYAIDAMVPVLAKFPKAVFLVLGDGDGLPEFKAQAERLGISEAVRFLGYREPVENIVSLFDIFAFPSLKEAMGIALVEALGQGVPAVASNIGGIPEVITPEVGLLVPAADASALATGLLELASNHESREAMSVAAVERAHARFGTDQMVDGTLDVYRALIAAGR